MCGICGIAYKDSERVVNSNTLIRIRDTMIHRGPDDCGLFIDHNIGLGHRRLSIIDISGGHQPMTNEDGSIWIVYNGEIYNFKEIRKNLEAKGHIFKTKTDTEVIIHAYEQYGIDCVHHFNGMFAFALWDSKKKLLFLARDRLGIKPLYYTIWNGTFLFASEIKAILAYDNFPKEVNTEVIEEYLIFRFVAGPNTFFKHIFNLLPGHILIWKDGQIYLKKYWDMELENKEEYKNEEEITEKLDALLKNSVHKRLISDVPLGTFNSGGLDSSLITAYVCKLKKEPIHTFSVGFYEKAFDESYYAKMLSKEYKTKHHEIKVTGKEFAKILPQMIYYHDEPLNHPNSVLIYYISKLAKNYVTVVLTGEGADELFAGYPRYFIPKICQVFKKVPYSPIFLKFIGNYIQHHKIKKLAVFSSMDFKSVLLYNSAFVNPDLVKKIIDPELIKQNFTYRYQLLSNRNLDNLRKLLYLDLKTYLVSILIRQDKMSMATSIESRVPYLDHRIVEFSYAIISRLKQKNWQTKYLLKKNAMSYLPLKIINRKKSGFGVPLSEWLSDANSLGQYLELLNDQKFDYLNYRYIQKIIKNKNQPDCSEILWSLINLALWYRIFIEVKTKL